MEKLRGEARGSERALEQALEELRARSTDVRQALTELRADAAAARSALEKILEEGLASARAESAGERKIAEEALSRETVLREEGEKTARERAAALEEELRRLGTTLDEAKAGIETKIETLRSAAADASKKWAAALRKTLDEFGE